MTPAHEWAVSVQPSNKVNQRNRIKMETARIAVTTRPYTRREFLTMAGGSMAVHALGAAGESESSRDQAKRRFQRVLQVPELLRPARVDATTDFYEIVQREALVELLPGKKTPIWGYQGMFPGPTIKVRQGRQVQVRHSNRLGIPTVVHLHGGRTPPDSDGFPTDYVMPGTDKTYSYPNDRAATLWYHDHALDHTGRNIFMGLAGLYIVEGDQEQNLALPGGEYDVPLLLQDRLFSADGALLYHPDFVDGPVTDTILVNGMPWPRMEVSASDRKSVV